MPEKEIKQNEQGQDVPTEAKLSRADVESHPMVGGLKSQLAELKAELDLLRSKKETEKEQAERTALEERGQYEAVKSKYEADLAATKREFEAYKVSTGVEAALLRAGATNKMFISGAIANYDKETPVEDYVTALAADESNAPMFAQPGQAPRQPMPSPPAGRPATGVTKLDYSQIKEDLQNPEKAASAALAIENYAIENGGDLPPGF